MVYDIDERFPEHQKVSDSVYQPNMNKSFKDADEDSSKASWIGVMIYVPVGVRF